MNRSDPDNDIVIIAMRDCIKQRDREITRLHQQHVADCSALNNIIDNLILELKETTSHA